MNIPGHIEPLDRQSPGLVAFARFRARLKAGGQVASKCVWERPELLVFGGLLALINAPVQVGSCWRSLMFQPDAVVHGQWWRLLTHPFVHATWYHLLLDATAFLSLYASLLEKSFIRRMSYVIGAAAGSLLLSCIGSSARAQGLCGLSGIAHGLMAISALEMIRHPSADVASRRVGWLTFAFVVIKAGFEALTGRMFFGFLDFGLLGDPVAVSHAGGVIGGLACCCALKLYWRKGEDSNLR